MTKVRVTVSADNKMQLVFQMFTIRDLLKSIDYEVEVAKRDDYTTEIYGKKE